MEKIECYICGYSVILHEHHIIPKSEGGCDHDKNKVELCPNHHGFLTYPNKNPIETENIRKQLPMGVYIVDCKKCMDKDNAMKRAWKITFILAGWLGNEIDNADELFKERKELMEKYSFKKTDLLIRFMGYSQKTLDELKEYYEG